MIPFHWLEIAGIFLVGSILGCVITARVLSFSAEPPATPPVVEAVAVTEEPRTVTVTKTVTGDCIAVESASAVHVAVTPTPTTPPVGEQSRFSLGADYPVERGRGTPHVEASARVADTPASITAGAGLDGSASLGLRWEFK